MYTFTKINYKICIHFYTFFTDGSNEVSLKDILSFFTGSSAVPPLWFNIDPTRSFNHNAVYPTASTCTFSLTLPTQYYNDINQLKLKMDYLCS